MNKAVAVFSVFVLAALPFIPWFAFPNSLSAKTFLVVALIDCVLLVCTTSLLKKGTAKLNTNRWLLMSVISLVAISIIATVFGVNPGHSFWGDSARLTGLFFFGHMAAWAFVLSEVCKKQDWISSFRIVSVSAGVYAALTIIGLQGLGYAGQFLWLDLSKTDPFFGNATFAGMHLLLAFIIGLIALIKETSKTWKITLLVSLVSIGLSPILLNIVPILLGNVEFKDLTENPQLYLGLTRASGAALLALAMFLAGWFGLTKLPQGKPRKLLKTLWASVVFVSVIAGSVAFLVPSSFVQKAVLDETTVDRFTVWESTFESIQERPLLGWGPENFYQAFETHASPSLYDETDRVLWFDRAHNVQLDTLASVGLLGALATLLMLGLYGFVVYRARKQGSIGEWETVLLLALPVAHYVQLQTAFEIVPTAVLLGFVGGYVLYLERLQTGESKTISVPKKAIGLATVLLASASLYTVFFYEMPRQLSLVASLSEEEAQTRSELLSLGLSRTSDYDGLHNSAYYFTSGIYKEVAAGHMNSEKVEQARQYLDGYLGGYERYLLDNPEHYRAQINYAYLLLMNQAWGGEENAEKVFTAIERARSISPGNPLTDVVATMAYAFAQDLPQAKRSLEAARSRAPNSDLVVEATKWLSKQEDKLDEISFLVIDNI